MAHEIKSSSSYSFAGRDFLRVGSELCLADVLGSFKARWGMGRMKYQVEPGLYAAGNPDENADVLVTVNYKMTFDRVRKELGGRDLWILVLDTKGINVWCAAGKGTFGTDELVGRIKAVELADIVSHKRLIVPQLGAVGVSAHKVKELSGFNVKYGPVRATDLPAYLDAGKNATDQMRLVEFPMWDRMVLVPMELVMNGLYILIAALLMLVLAGFSRGGYSMELVVKTGLPSALLLLAVYSLSTALGSIVLPAMPGKAFSVKGFWAGLLVVLLFGVVSPVFSFVNSNWLTMVSWLLVTPAIASFMVMNFTGTSTYTSLSGVRKEMRVAVPLQLAASVIAVVLWVAGRFVI